MHDTLEDITWHGTRAEMRFEQVYEECWVCYRSFRPKRDAR